MHFENGKSFLFGNYFVHTCNYFSNSPSKGPSSVLIIQLQIHNNFLKVNVYPAEWYLSESHIENGDCMMVYHTARSGGDGIDFKAISKDDKVASPSFRQILYIYVFLCVIPGTHGCYTFEHIIIILVTIVYGIYV